MDIEEIMQARREALKTSLRTLTNAEVTDLASTLFPYSDDPWRERFLAFVSEHPGSTYYHASLPDEVEVIYCRPEGRGIWFIPRKGLGPLQPRGLGMLDEITRGVA